MPFESQKALEPNRKRNSCSTLFAPRTSRRRPRILARICGLVYLNSLVEVLVGGYIPGGEFFKGLFLVLVRRVHSDLGKGDSGHRWGSESWSSNGSGSGRTDSGGDHGCRCEYPGSGDTLCLICSFGNRTTRTCAHRDASLLLVGWATPDNRAQEGGLFYIGKQPGLLVTIFFP